MPKPSCRWCGLIVGSRRSFHIHHLHHSGQLRRPCLLFICQHEPRKGHPCQKAYESKRDVLVRGRFYCQRVLLSRQIDLHWKMMLFFTWDSNFWFFLASFGAWTPWGFPWKSANRPSSSSQVPSSVGCCCCKLRKVHRERIPTWSETRRGSTPTCLKCCCCWEKLKKRKRRGKHEKSYWVYCYFELN